MQIFELSAVGAVLPDPEGEGFYAARGTLVERYDASGVLRNPSFRHNAVVYELDAVPLYLPGPPPPHGTLHGWALEAVGASQWSRGFGYPRPAHWSRRGVKAQAIDQRLRIWLHDLATWRLFCPTGAVRDFRPAVEDLLFGRITAFYNNIVHGVRSASDVSLVGLVLDLDTTLPNPGGAVVCVSIDAATGAVRKPRRGSPVRTLKTFERYPPYSLPGLSSGGTYALHSRAGVFVRVAGPQGLSGLVTPELDWLETPPETLPPVWSGPARRGVLGGQWVSAGHFDAHSASRTAWVWDDDAYLACEGPPVTLRPHRRHKVRGVRFAPDGLSLWVWTSHHLYRVDC